MSDLRAILERGVAGATPPPDGFERMLRRRDRKHRNQRIAAGVVGIAVFVAAVWIVTTGGPFDRTSTPGGGTEVTGPTGQTGPPPHPIGVGLLGFPPEDATPSTPERGELVVSFGFGRSAGDPGRFNLAVYADGRVIWQRLALPGVWDGSTGLIEQHLTPEGVELVRAEVLSTGLFIGGDFGRVDRELVGPLGGLHFGSIQVRAHGLLQQISWGDVGFGEDREPVDKEVRPEDVRALERLDRRLEDLGSWLPASAWEDQEMRAYVPSRYSVCYSGQNQALERSLVLDLLPPAVEDVLRPLEARGDEFRGPFGPVAYWCSTITTDQARELAGILEDAGASRNDPDFPSYAFASPGGPEIDIAFDALLPDN